MCLSDNSLLFKNGISALLVARAQILNLLLISLPYPNPFTQHRPLSPTNVTSCLNLGNRLLTSLALKSSFASQSSTRKPVVPIQLAKPQHSVKPNPHHCLVMRPHVAWASVWSFLLTPYPYFSFCSFCSYHIVSLSWINQTWISSWAVMPVLLPPQIHSSSRFLQVTRCPFLSLCSTVI